MNKRVNLTLSDSLYKQCEEFAKQTDNTVPGAIRHIIAIFFVAKEHKNNKKS